MEGSQLIDRQDGRAEDVIWVPAELRPTDLSAGQHQLARVQSRVGSGCCRNCSRIGHPGLLPEDHHSLQMYTECTRFVSFELLPNLMRNVN